MSRNFDKVTLGMNDEPITHESEQGLIDGIKGRFKLLRKMIEEEFREIQK